jgi:VWFA-related protein
MLNTSTRILVSLLLPPLFIIFTGFSGLAKPAESQARFKSEVNLVQVEARITREGKPVEGLKKEDFRLRENGEVQDISFLDFIESPSEIAFESETVADVRSGSGNNKETAPAQAAKAPPEPSWIYLLPEVGNPFEFRRTAIAIRDFINKEFQPGFYVSLGGLPYTDNKEMLLATLDRLEDKPYGKGTGITPEIMQLQQLEDMRRIAQFSAIQNNFNTIEDDLAHESMFYGGNNPRIDNVPMISVETVARQIMFYGQLAMFRYMDLVERMALLPGKKSIVLFRSGLRMDRGNNPLMNRLLASAARNRVSFYTVDSRGLDVAAPVKEAQRTMAFARTRLDRNRPDPMGENNRRKDSEEGLIHLAEETGGRVVLSSNDLGSILTKVVEDSISYYVLSYYPSSISNKGKFRKIEVSLPDIKGCKVSFVKGYYEPKPINRQSSNERLLSLKETLQTSISRDLRISAEPEVIADVDGRPVLYLSLAVPVEDFKIDKNKKKSEIKAEFLLQVTNHYSLQMPLYQNSELKGTFTRDDFKGGEHPRLTYQTMLPLAPGYYHLTGIVRDRESGVHGIYKSSVVVRDLNASSVPSTLIMTKYVVPWNPKNKEDIAGRLLSAGENVYWPQADHAFRRGDAVYAMFHVYNATPEDFAWAAKGVQVGLLQNDQLVQGVSIYGKPLPEPDSGLIRYVVMFETADLEPGEYTFLAMLPNYPSRSEQQLEEKLVILE